MLREGQKSPVLIEALTSFVRHLIECVDIATLDRFIGVELFGSRVTGHYGVSSDQDMCIRLKPTKEMGSTGDGPCLVL